MGSIWCKPSEMRQDCSPKLNIHSLISRFSSQMCPNKCRYPQTGVHPRKKPRPRSAVLSQGKRPEISSPLVQPIPPPRKKRKNTQDMSRSEEILCPQEYTNPALRPSASLPTIYNPNPIILRNCIDIKQPMASIVEENTITNKSDVNEAEMDSLPPSEVYFLKKEEIPVVFTEAKSVADITENDEYLNNKKPMNDTFTAINEPESIPEQIVKNETIKVTDEVQKSSEKEISDNKLSSVKDRTDTASIKKWQDAMKKKWLQSILIEDEPKDISNHVTVNGCLQINTTLNLENKLSAEKSDGNINEDISLNSSSNITNNPSIDLKNQDDNDNKTNKTLKNILENTQEQIPKLLVTPKTLSETLERLQNVDLSNQDNLRNNRNLIYSSENLNNMNNSSQNSKGNKDLKQDKLKDTLKLDANLEERLYSNRNSRHSSITDSLHEFETSIYDMLQQSAKENVSDEDNSLLIIDVKDKSNECVVNAARIETTQTC